MQDLNWAVNTFPDPTLLTLPTPLSDARPNT